MKQIEADGWKHIRTTWSHRQHKHPSKPNVVTIPGHFREMTYPLER
jgi:predicted RNA binding protein YcfA (HicA-like mRNA interferase family)